MWKKNGRTCCRKSVFSLLFLSGFSGKEALFIVLSLLLSLFGFFPFLQAGVGVKKGQAVFFFCVCIFFPVPFVTTSSICIEFIFLAASEENLSLFYLWLCSVEISSDLTMILDFNTKLSSTYDHD